jgi:hypothetical protein
MIGFGTAGDRRRRVQSALLNRRLDVVVERIARDARIEFVGTQSSSVTTIAVSHKGSLKACAAGLERVK